MDSTIKIKVGIIGTGVGIRTHLNSFRLFSETTEVYAISGSSLERSNEFAKKYNIPVACSDYKELCDIDELDLVCITAPNKFHKEMIEYAIKKNKNIICEKPMVDTIEDAEYIVNISKDYEKIFIINHQLRFNPYILKMKELINNGTLGNIYNVKINQEGIGFANENANWSWSFDADQGGGVRLAMASHFTDLVQFLFNSRPVISVMATLNPVTKSRVDSIGNIRKVLASTTCNAFIMLKDELTIQYSINAGSYNKSRFDISIFGDKGELIFTLEDKLNLYLKSSIGECIKIVPDEVYQDEKENRVSIFSGSFRYLASKMISAILNDDMTDLKIATKAIDQLYTIEILEAIKKSANIGKSVSMNKEENEYS